MLFKKKLIITKLSENEIEQNEIETASRIGTNLINGVKDHMKQWLHSQLQSYYQK